MTQGAMIVGRIRRPTIPKGQHVAFYAHSPQWNTVLCEAITLLDSHTAAQAANEVEQGQVTCKDYKKIQKGARYAHLAKER
jgi:hypothetical protein